MKAIQKISAFVGVLVLGVSMASAETITFKQGSNVASSDGEITVNNYQGTQDSYIYSKDADHSYGSDGVMGLAIGEFPVGTDFLKKSLIRFDVSAMNGEFSQINSVELRLYMQSATGYAGSAVDVHRINSTDADWVEGTCGDEQVGSSCWNHKKYDTVAWAGGAGNPGTISDQLAVVSGQGIGWFEWDLDPSSFTLTQMITDWAAASTNEGLLLDESNTPTTYYTHYFRSSECADQDFTPELVIDYEVIPEPTTWILLATAGLVLLLVRRRRRK